MDLNEIQSFIAIVEQGSMTKAAQEIKIPKSTLSRHLINLEKRLGITLIQRSTRKISLTALGREYYHTCSQSLKDLYIGEKKLLDDHVQPRGLIRFTAPLEIGTFFLSEAIAEFSKKNPEIYFDINYTDRVVDIIKENYDLALRAGKISDISLVSKKFGQDIFVLVASPEYLSKSSPIKTPEDISGHRCWLFSQMSNNDKWKLYNGKMTKSIQVEKKFQTNSMQSIKNIIIAGGGISYLPYVLVKNSILSGELTNVLPNWNNESGHLHLCYPQQKKIPLRLRLFIDYLLASVDQNFNFKKV